MTGGTRRMIIIVAGSAAAVGLLVIGVAALTQTPDERTTPALPRPTATATVSATSTVPATPSPVATPADTATPTQDPDAVQLRPDGLGPLQIGMTAEEAVATDLVERDTSVVTGGTTLVAGRRLPGVIVSYSSQRDAVVGFMVKDGSPIQTPEGIGVDSTGDDVRAAYGSRVDEREDGGSTFFVVPFGDAGYAFFPTERQMIMAAATEERLATIRPGTEL